MAIYLFSQILKSTKYRIKLNEKLPRRHFINSSDVFVIKGFTVELLKLKLNIKVDNTSNDFKSPKNLKHSNYAVYADPFLSEQDNS